MKLKNLEIKDKKIVNDFLRLSRHELSVYTFENIYIWKGLFDISWVLIEGALCIFFKDKIGCFLYLEPLAENKNIDVLNKIFAIMDKFNKNKDISRIENIEEKEVSFYERAGYSCRLKSHDYLYLTSDLIKLKGNRFKSKRSCFNYFIKHYNYEYLPFSLKHKGQCLKLYERWMKERKNHNQNSLYCDMLEDGFASLKDLLGNYKDLNSIGRVVKIDKEVRAFTFGVKLNTDSFCVLFEITDLSVKGLAQFIFREFCREISDYKCVNIMDDSGLENLKRAKLSYQPTELIPAYIASRDLS